jgi:O-antigen ligase
MPASLLGWLSPGSTEMHAGVRALPAGHALDTLSIGPGASLDQLILSLDYFALFWLVMITVARNRQRQRFVLLALVLCGVAEALYGSVMTLSGLEYGFFAPKTTNLGWATGTFVNRNHLAGYLELTLASGVALVLADLRTVESVGWKEWLAQFVDLLMSPRMRTRVMIVIMVVAMVLTRSRMGNVALFVSLAMTGIVYVMLRHPKYLLKSLVFFVSMFVIDLFIVSDQYGLQKVAERIQSTNLQTEQRMIALNDLKPVVDRYWFAGSGLGTFGVAFSPYRSAEVVGYFDHAHNDHLEFVIESGVVGYGILCALAGLCVIHGILLIRRRREPMAAALGFAGSMALVSLAIHGLADFNLHIPAVAATLVTLMALILSCSSHSRGSARTLDLPTAPRAG